MRLHSRWEIRFRFFVLILPFALFACPSLSAQQNLSPVTDKSAPPEQSQPAAAKQILSDADNATALEKAAQNPVASLISVPIQENWNPGIQPGDRTQNVLNIQPVIPLSVGKDWNLIIRWITPVIYQP